METTPVFVGIELQHAWQMVTLAAVDERLKLTALRSLRLAEVGAFLAENANVLAAVCAPPHPNRGRMLRDEMRAGLFAPLPGNHSADLRQAEYECLARGLPAWRTPADTSRCPAWMRRGFRLHRLAESLGYTPFGSAPSPRQVLETNPEGVFACLLGHIPFPFNSLEGRIQRQLILWDHHLPVHDPMIYFEEITRHKLLRGILPDQEILPIAKLNSLAAAYTAYLVTVHPERVARFGEPEEGELYLPAQKTD